MKFPLVGHLLKSLFRKPVTNPFPAAHLPDSVGGFLADAAAGKARLNPPVPMPPGGRARVAYDAGKCIGCRMCVNVCPAHAIDYLADRKKIRLFRANCIACGQCADVCPKKCLAMDGVFLQADENRFSDALVAR